MFKMKNSVKMNVWAVVAVFLLLIVFVPSVSSAATGVIRGTCSGISGGLDNVISCATVIFNYAIYLLMAAAVVYIVYYAFVMLSNEEKRGEARTSIIYGIIGLFIMISIWGFVNILANTFGLSDTKASQFENDYRGLIPTP